VRTFEKRSRARAQVPSIATIQAFMEAAWARGFDEEGTVPAREGTLECAGHTSCTHLSHA
jgi:hypothetical protein